MRTVSDSLPWPTGEQLNGCERLAESRVLGLAPAEPQSPVEDGTRVALASVRTGAMQEHEGRLGRVGAGRWRGDRKGKRG